MTMQAMIFAAGLGTRLKPLTDNMPKALVEVGGQTLLQRTLIKLKNAGANHVVVNVHHFADQIKAYLCAHDNFGMVVDISDESTSLLNTGGGVKKAGYLFSAEENILIHNVDILSNVDLRKFYASHSACDALLLVSERQTKRYLLFDNDRQLVGWTNVETGEVRSPYPDLRVEDCSRYAFAGIHSFSPRLLSAMDAFPDKFSIVDFYLSVCAKCRISGYVKPDLKLLDVGKLDTLKRIAKSNMGMKYLTDEQILEQI